MLTPCLANGSSSACTAPGRFCADITSEVSSRPEGARGGVVDAHDRVVGLTRLGGTENFVEGCVGLGVDEIPEMPGNRGVAERSCRPEIRDAKFLLERETGRHDLAENGGDGVVG